MEKKYKITLLPAALVCFGSESLSASINAKETKNFNSYDVKPVKIDFNQKEKEKENKKISRSNQVQKKENLYQRQNSQPQFVKEKRKNPLKKTKITQQSIEKQKKEALKKLKSTPQTKKEKKEKLASEILKQKATITIKKTQKKLSKVTQEANKKINKIKRRGKAIVKLASKKLQENRSTQKYQSKKTNVTKIKYVLQKRQKINNKITLTKFKKPKEIKRFKKKIQVIATAYTSHTNQTDKTPFLAAWNNKIKPGMKIIAVSRDLIKKYGLTNGKKVKIQGLPGLYTVRDKMNKRYKSRIDIYMGLNKKKALRWGKRKIVLYIQ